MTRDRKTSYSIMTQRKIKSSCIEILYVGTHCVGTDTTCFLPVIVLKFANYARLSCSQQPSLTFETDSSPNNHPSLSSNPIKQLTASNYHIKQSLEKKNLIQKRANHINELENQNSKGFRLHQSPGPQASDLCSPPLISFLTPRYAPTASASLNVLIPFPSFPFPSPCSF